MPSRNGPSGARRDSASATTVPVIRAATAVQSEIVSGSARCGWPLEITRATRSMSPARTTSPDRVGLSAGG